MAKSKKQKEKPTNPAGESQKLGEKNQKKNLPRGVDKRGGQSPK